MSLLRLVTAVEVGARQLRVLLAKRRFLGVLADQPVIPLTAVVLVLAYRLAERLGADDLQLPGRIGNRAAP